MYRCDKENRRNLGIACKGVEYFTADSWTYKAGDCNLSSSDDFAGCPNQIYHVAFYPTGSSAGNAPVKLYRSSANAPLTDRFSVLPALPLTIDNAQCSSAPTMTPTMTSTPTTTASPTFGCDDDFFEWEPGYYPT